MDAKILRHQEVDPALIDEYMANEALKTLPPKAERDAMAAKWVCTVPGCSETVYKPGPCESCRDRFGDEMEQTH
jgi:hypothetical protein